MAKRFGYVCGKGGKRKSRGSRFLKITARGVVIDVTKEFTGRAAKEDRRKRSKKRKSTSNFGRKRSGRLEGFVSLKQKRAALRNVKKAQRANKRHGRYV
jgi:hypothetical protein